MDNKYDKFDFLWWHKNNWYFHNETGELLWSCDNKFLVWKNKKVCLTFVDNWIYALPVMYFSLFYYRRFVICCTFITYLLTYLRVWVTDFIHYEEEWSHINCPSSACTERESNACPFDASSKALCLSLSRGIGYHH